MMNMFACKPLDVLFKLDFRFVCTVMKYECPN